MHRPGGLQNELTRLGNEITALGAVNLAALEELQVAQERKAYLDAQAKDLNEAIETLEDAIRRIDKESRDLLMATYDEVNRHLSELFPVLFGGGDARLVLTGDEILDSGVQVMAHPPGKKNASIHLLSGGEKALTAIALVFSLFQLNPAPFCVAGRGGCAAGRYQYRALMQSDPEDGGEDPVRLYQSQQDHHGNGAATDWRDHAGTRRFQSGVGGYRRSTENA